MQCATDLFAANGYDASNVSQIRMRAKVSKGAFYHHFSRKNDLFMELFHAWWVNIDQLLLTIRKDSVNM